MLDKELFKEKMEKLLTFFPNWNVDLSDRVVAGMWYSQFGHMSDEKFSKAVEDYIENEQFNPTVAGIKKYYVPDPKKSAVEIAHEKMLEEQERMLKAEGRIL